MKDISIWVDKVIKPKYPTINSDIDCDILIIGGGITGICCAYFLKDLNQKIILAEGNKIAMGATSKSTGKLTYLQEDYLNKIYDAYDLETLLKYVESQKEAIKIAKKIITENNIKCNFEPAISYLYANKHINKFKIHNLYDYLVNDFNIQKSNSFTLDKNCKISIKANDTYVFHPVKFVYGIANLIKNDIDIYENTRILNIRKCNNYYLCKTKKGNIKTKKIILACHYPFFIYPYFFPFKTTIEKSFLIASEINDKTNSYISAINVENEISSFRYYHDKKNYLIMVAKNHKLYKNTNDIKTRNEIMWKMRSNFSPKANFCWSNHDIITFDYMPIIGEIDSNMFLATGYNTWGMTNGILAGKIISDLISNNHNKYNDLFNPYRTFKNVPQLLSNNINNGCAFLGSKLFKDKIHYDNNVKIIKQNGITYGIYIDEKNKEHKVYNLCPHMKCNLYFNYQTKTWDCPCHGSSFDIDGNIIYGPSTYSIKIKKSK